MTPGIYAPVYESMHILPASHKLRKEPDYVFWRSMALDLVPTSEHLKGSKP